MRTVAIVSGGMDSVTLAYLLKQQGDQLHLLSFDYGQRHRKELLYAEHCAARLGCGFDVITLHALANLITASALTGGADVPDGHYTEDSMRITVVPNRNAVMLALAFAVAVNEKADRVALAVHTGDHFIYPDCRPAFLDAFQAMQNLATEGFGQPRLYAPFREMTKAEIVETGALINVPYQETWSCYKGGGLHCGVCGTCTERREAFELAEVPDPTEYADLTRHW